VADADLQELERAWQASGSVEDEASYLRERVRTGDLSDSELELLAGCGHAAACRLRPSVEVAAAWEPLVRGEGGERQVELLCRVGASLTAEVGLSWVEHARDRSLGALRERLLSTLRFGALESLSLEGLPEPTGDPEEQIGVELLAQVVDAVRTLDSGLVGMVRDGARQTLRNPEAWEAVGRAELASVILGYAVPSQQRLKIRYSKQTLTADDNTYASDPGEVSLSLAKLERLAPELCTVDRGLKQLWKRVRGEDPMTEEDVQWWRTNLSEHLAGGDSRAAVVVSVAPLVVAAYTDELDCVILLRFPSDYAGAYELRVGSRLLTVNRYAYLEDGMAPDAYHGPLSFKRYGDFTPYVAEFYSDDLERIARRKAEILEPEWARCELMGKLLLSRGQPPRGGKPHEARFPATRLAVEPDAIAHALQREGLEVTHRPE